MELDNVDVWGALDMDPPAQEPEPPEGEQEQEPAAPASTGEQEQEIADPAHDDEEGGSEDGEEPEQQPENRPLTKEERKANAVRRREKEVKDAVEAALKQERQENEARLKRFFAQAQLKNQHQNGAVIGSLEEAEQWAAQDRIAKMRSNLKKGTLTEQDLQTAMEQSPAFRALQDQQNAYEQKALQDQQKGFTQNVELELAQIQKLNPEIKSLADIIQMPTGKEFGRYVQQYGMSYLEAYKLANHDQIVEQAKNVAAAGARMAAGGKEHLTKTTTRGNPPIDIPKDVREGYRMFNPDMSDADIEKAYRKYLGQK